MLLVAPVRTEIRKEKGSQQQELFGLDKLKVARSTIPAITHVDYSARVQTVTGKTNPVYYNLIKKFDEQSDCAVVINTSFNVRGEPIVCTPQDAYRCFMRTDMDYLAIGSFLLDKTEHKPIQNDSDRQSEFELD